MTGACSACKVHAGCAASNRHCCRFVMLAAIERVDACCVGTAARQMSNKQTAATHGTCQVITFQHM